MKKFILTLILCLSFSLPIYAGFGSGDQIGADNPATADLDMDAFDIYVTSIIAKDSTGLYLLNDGNKGIVIKDDGKIGIGIYDPTQRLEIVHDSYLIIMGKVTATQADKRTMMVGARARGSLTTPLAVQAGDYLVSFFGQGYDGSGYDTSSQIEFITSENWTDSAHGSYITFHTVDNGTTTIDIRMCILHNGYIGVGTSTPNTKFEVRDGSITISGTNANLIVEGYSYFGSSVTISSHVVVLGDMTITGTVVSTATYALNSDKLDGHDSLYFAIDTDLDTEIASRISEDNLISDATEQIRIDFEAYDSTLNGSTTTLRTDVTNLWTSTNTLEAATTLNTTHRSSDGSDHSFIDQDVTISGTPTHSSMTITNGLSVNGNIGIGTVTPTAALQLGNDKLIAVDANAGLTASTNQSQGQGALTAQVNEIATVANDGDAVTLPSAVAGVEVAIINNSTNTLQIFPASGDSLGLGTNNSEELEANERVLFIAYDNDNWAKEATTEIIHAEIHDEDNTDAFTIVDAGTDFQSYHTNGLVAGDLADWTFDAGGAGASHAIIEVFDAGGGDIAVVTSDAHGLEVGDIVSQANLADGAYTGVFEVLSIPTASTYTVTAAFTATDTGTMDQAATLEANAVAAGSYSFAYYISATPVGANETFDFRLYKEATVVTGSKVRAKFGAGTDFNPLSGGGIVQVNGGDKISLALSNESSAANLTLRNFTLVLIRL